MDILFKCRIIGLGLASPSYAKNVLPQESLKFCASLLQIIDNECFSPKPTVPSNKYTIYMKNNRPLLALFAAFFLLFTADLLAKKTSRAFDTLVLRNHILADSVVPKNMVFVPGGTFEMGDVYGDGEEWEKPVHTVMLSNFYIGKTEVTFDEYDAFCTATGRKKPSDAGWGRGKRPAINVRWHDAVAYCNWLSEQQGLIKVYTINESTVTADWNANGYRLPTEAEWEYAARGGGKSVRFGNGKDVADPAQINFAGSPANKTSYSRAGVFREKTTPVGSFQPNALGLRDMAGNVWEWCWDWLGDDYYGKSEQNNPIGPVSGSRRVLRGGSWGNPPDNVRVTYRNGRDPMTQDYDYGFRLARSEPKD